MGFFKVYCKNLGCGEGFIKCANRIFFNTRAAVTTNGMIALIFNLTRDQTRASFQSSTFYTVLATTGHHNHGRNWDQRVHQEQEEHKMVCHGCHVKTPRENNYPAMPTNKEIKDSLDALAADFTEFREEQQKILNLAEEVKQLRLQINEKNGRIVALENRVAELEKGKEKDEKIAMLENRIADLEQYSRMNDVIVTGFAIKPRSFAAAVTGSATEEGMQLNVSGSAPNNAELQVTDFLRSKGIKVDGSCIEACHPLPRSKARNTPNTPAVILRFTNRKHKVALVKQRKQPKNTSVYLNEHLSKKNADIAKRARFLRKQEKIQSTWTADCKVFIKLNGTPEESKVMVIKDIKELDKYQ